MTPKEYLLDAIQREVRNMKHLWTKIPEGSIDWKPLDDMRTTRHLLQYLSFVGTAYTEAFVHPLAPGEESMKRIREHSAKSSDLKPEDFPNAMDAEFALMKEMIESVPDAEFMTRMTTFPWGGEVGLYDALLNGPLKYFTAYRHQLFLYARMNGAKIVTSDNWRGVSPTPAPKLEKA